MTLVDKLKTTNFSLRLGNGINRYASDEHDLNHSWRGVLRAIAMERGALPGDAADEILDDPSGVSFPEFIDLISLDHGGNQADDQPTIKQELSEMIAGWVPSVTHSRVVNYCHSHDIPILTTNYDTLLAQSAEHVIDFVTNQNRQTRKKHLQSPINQRGRGFTRYYPWHSFYSDKDVSDSDVLDSFAIWHVHGVHHYPDSIRLGLMDYMSFITRAKAWIQTGIGARWRDPASHEDWDGANSWLDLFLHKPLVIAGLALDVQETTLRWLLIERARFYRRNATYGEAGAWYYIAFLQDGEVSAAKQHFIQSLGGTIITYESYGDFYGGAFGG